MILRDVTAKFVKIFVSVVYIFSTVSFHHGFTESPPRGRGPAIYSDVLYENSSICTAHISQLSEENFRLQQELEFFKHKNNELSFEMTSLRDHCNDGRQNCEYNGKAHAEGDIWHPDSCTTCRCESGFPHCYTSYHSSECAFQCSEDVCLNGGSCQLGHSTNSVQCSCPDGFSGPLCEQTVCIPMKIEGQCDYSENSWYFDSHSNLCKPTGYDCFDPRSTFSTYESCSHSCLQGTCCYRMKIGDIEDMICQAETMENCQILCQEEQVEVIGFYPGIKCPDKGCAIVASKTCHTGIALYSPGSKFSFGCDSCECLEEQILCSCHALSIRREIREFSYVERIQYQQLLSKLQVGGEKSVWNSLRNLYVTHIMHSNSPIYFLIWNRNFLRTMERHLQEHDCSATIPYFDFTLDAGNLSASVVWREDYFGAPASNTSHCKRYTVPGTHITWTPCIVRDFKLQSNVLTMVDIAMALTKSDFFEFTSALQGITNFFHSFIGGDMNSEGGPSDPLFYSFHAYIDLLFWKWQKRYEKGAYSFYNDKILHAVLSPFNTEQRHLLDLERDLCVSYKSIGSDDNFQDQSYYFPNYDYNPEENDIYSECSNPSGGCYDSDMRYILNAGHQIQTVLYNQDERFLKTVPRTCSPPPDVKSNHINQAWNVHSGDFKVWPNVQPIERMTDWCKRFCFTADIFLPPENETNVKTCSSKSVPVCDNSALLQCPYYTYAPCRLSLCGNCSLTCHVNNQEIDCGKSKPDFCSPNPCKNGGICQRSRWPSLPHLVSCACLPGFTERQSQECWKKNHFCSPNPCKNGGICQRSHWPSLPHLVSCDCLPGFTERQSQEYFCSPSPCKNGGICQRSRWPSLPHLVSCDCLPGFTGEFCEETSDQRCFLPQNPGKAIDGCGPPEKRWYFDVETQDCYSFHYYGCSGNANNFPSYYECRISCMIGACCWRKPLFPNNIHGYSKEGYDRYGFNIKGRSPKKEKRTFDNGYGGDKKIFRFSGFDYQGYDRKGFNNLSLDRYGYDTQSFHHVTRFNLTGYDSLGDHDGIIEFNKYGFNADGYNRAGLNCFGYNKDGWDYYGLSAGWSYECRAMSLKECQKTEEEYSKTHSEVISFSPGKKCEEVNCEQLCGCNFLGKSISTGTRFNLGCGTCECGLSHRINCPCTTTSIRKEVRDLTYEELVRYQNAIKALVLQKSPSIWDSFTHLYRNFLPQSRDNPFFLPWHRYFLRYVEMKLQEVDCSVTIPYFDWTLDVGNLESSIVWQANMFGGNGEKSDDFCVKHHPFKNHHPGNWKTCLRRNFNNSIHLPNAVEVEKVSRLHTFEEFSFEINKFSSLFHLFVGGHMATPDAVYDPIFLSFYAYIDKIWYDWFVTNPNNVEKFPQEFRYISMMPFGVAPDDVLLSMTQLCVSYMQITDGALCASNGIHSNALKERSGVSNEIFDNDGYDYEGYDKHGFDRLGWNRKGFNRDSFNRDNFDSSGFDRRGYNRYGLDRHGCNAQGMCFFENDFPKRKKNTWEDFSEMGFRPTGVDFHGYDIYGFDVNGLDKENCSNFFKGPFYPKLMKNTKDKLKNLKTDELNRIPRICPDPSSLPLWWLNLYWLNRKSNNGDMAIKSVGAENLFVPFSTNVWIAPTPDERFCFPLQVHTKCELHQLPVPCPFQKCHTSVCPTQSSAKCRSFGCGTCDEHFLDVVSQKTVKCNENGCVSMNGTVRKDGEVWEEDMCHTCTCKAGLVSCSAVQCDTSCDHPMVIPEACCPVCDGCMKNNILFRNGDSFIDPENPCLRCSCRNGTILCTTVDCPPMKPCRKNAVIVLPGECCPKCSMCGPHHEGSHWMESPCHNCTCEGGNVHCSVIECPMPSCHYPARSSEECCRRCNDCEYSGSYVRDEEVFQPGNCQECRCQKGNISCKTIDCHHPKCQTSENDECCELCKKGCLYDGKDYKNGDQFTPDFNPCLNCSCQKSLVRCQPLSCPVNEKSCNVPVLLPGKCCPECPSCMYKNQQYPNGARWRAANGSCEICRCIDGNVFCSERETCNDRKCTHGVLPKGACCSPCTECQYSNHIVPDQMQFSPPDDPCARCICQHGNITCVRETCPKLLCRVTELPSGACCPVCKGCKNSIGQTMEHKQRWIHPTDICQVCSCEDGVSKCERLECDIPCTHPVMQPHHCCPECNDCQVMGRIYKNNQEIPSTDPCKRCFCFRGNMECESIRCPTLTCDAPEKKSGECCPTCKICKFQGDTYKDGEKFQPKSDSCYYCICDKGAVQCDKKDKCNPQCSDPVKLPNQCCPVCDGCQYEGKIYRNRERFTPNPLEACLKCECINGNVKCLQEHCPPLNCSFPVRTPGQCCEECPQVCYEKVSNKTYQEGEMWVPANDACKICTCKNSQPVCKQYDCPSPNCLHAAAPFGVCCRECDHCEFTHRLYRNGQEFTHEDDPCQICKCLNGNVTCETVHCDPLPCVHPEELEGLCCPVCAPDVQCHYLGKTYEAWENFMDPTNHCSECVCIEGMVSCHQVMCLDSSCPNPQLGHCCESCDGCSYGEKNYINHISFKDPFNHCRECECDNGVVSCQQKSCPPVSCQHYSVMEGDCCPGCEAVLDCIFKDKTYFDGETFSDPDDPCIECYCQFPDVTCHDYDCDEDSCLDPVRSQCCDSCSDCTFMGSTYEAGSSFVNPQNHCEDCICEEGRVACFEKPCPPIWCSHPIRSDCCLVCNEGCLFENEMFDELDVFQDPKNPCQECSCRNGSILCQTKICAPLTCEYPVKDACCSVCQDCFYKNEIIKNRQKIDHDGSDVCKECFCSDGNIECKHKPCPTVYCSDPVIQDCCPVCHLGCFYGGEVYRFGAEFDHPNDPCSECACMDGSVHCDRKPCESPTCKHPITDSQHCCPYCPNYCIYDGQRYTNNSVFADVTDVCKECTCMSGDVICETRICPEIKCLHPAQGQCCLECEKCDFSDTIYADGENFTNPNNPCETCLCSKGQVACRRNPCVQCLHPLLKDFNCCPLCDGCSYKGINYTNQELFIDPGNACEECVCKNGTVTCHELSCSLPSCSNPVYLPDNCCPVCPGCNFEGIQFEENEEFPHPDNVCEKCICKDSLVACKTQICHRNCTHPTPDPCCPICDSCMYETIKYENGERFNPDPCRTCECKDGNVLCTSEECPELHCQLRIRLPGTCCETCRGCYYEGHDYENGETWFSSTNPCLSCSCNGGTVSCQNIVCPIECSEPIPVPGLCCPVCPECEQDGKVYKSGEVFSPEESPCDSCSCDSGSIFCIRHECPTLVGCPEEAIKPPGEGDCCPTCAAFGTSCTRDQIGKSVYPTGDPCFSCQCTEKFMWVCSKEFCPQLNCPADEILTVETECCPKCKVCLSEGVEMHYHGDSWTSTNDVCSSCYCDYGIIKCNKIICPPIRCTNGQFEFLPPTECCPICTSSRDLSCDYGGHYYEHGQIWNPDPCTTCQCSGGKMKCVNERCLPLHCSSDEIKSVDPGQCCPKCIPRPATCIAFGDPHYKTFDGATFSFQGTCRYVLTADCSTQQFNVLVENNDRGFNGVSWTHRVVVVLQNASVDLRAGPSVYVKGKHIEHLPYFEDPVLYVEKTGSSVLVTTNVGVKVLWNGDGYVEVIVSGVYRDKTCGLCGNFNNFPEDDMRTPTNEIVSSEAKFGNSWKNPGVQPEGCSESVDIDPCSKGGYRIRKIANSKCSILKQSLFAACHRFIPPESYFAACVYDVCACSENDDCLCDILSAYSQECSKAGIIVHWRSEGLCGIHCSREEGLVFDECGPPCPRTCENLNVPIGILAAQCFKPCVPGCQCSADKVLHNGRCIQPDKCP